MDEAKVEVTVDTEKAKKELEKLKEEARKRAREIAASISNGLSRGFEFVGLGGGVGMVTSALRGPTQQAYSGIISESFGAYGKQIEKFFLGDLGQEARAGQSAREQTIQAFGMVAGVQNQIPPGAKNYFNQVRALRENEEKGRAIFERDSNYYGVQPGDIFERFMTGIGKALGTAVDYLVSKLSPFK